MNDHTMRYRDTTTTDLIRPRMQFSKPVRGGLLSIVLLCPLLGCDSVGSEAANKKDVAPTDHSENLVQLTAEEIEAGDVAVQPVIRSGFSTFRDFPATVGPNHHKTAEITALVRGRVVEVYADLGQQVKAGESLAILYSNDLVNAQSAYLKAIARLYVAERSYERAQLLLKEKVIPLAESQRRRGEMLSMRAEKLEALGRLRLLGMNTEQIQRLDRDEKIHSHVPITAPFDGRVITRNLTKGEVVEVTEKLFTVADLSEVWVLANIPEKDISFIRPNSDASGVKQEVEVLLTAYPEEVFHGEVTYIGDVLDVGTRTMNLRIEVPNPDRKLKPEMYATIRVYSEPEKNVLAVPEQAVQRERDRRFVFVQRDHETYEVRDVALGESNGEVVKVLAGLHEGERVVTAGAFILKSELLGEQM